MYCNAQEHRIANLEMCVFERTTKRNGKRTVGNWRKLLKNAMGSFNYKKNVKHRNIEIEKKMMKAIITISPLTKKICF